MNAQSHRLFSELTEKKKGSTCCTLAEIGIRIIKREKRTYILGRARRYLTDVEEGGKIQNGTVAWGSSLELTGQNQKHRG